MLRDLATNMQNNEQAFDNATMGKTAGAGSMEIGSYTDSVNWLKNIACSERPQQRLEVFGSAALSDTELLAILLRSGIRGCDVLTLSSRIIGEAGGIAALASWTEPDFRRVKGIGKVKAYQLVAIMEIARRMIDRTVRESQPLLKSAEAIDQYLKPITASLEVEKFWVLCLDRKNRLIKRVEVTSGTATSTLAHPREVLRAAIRQSASAFACAHNHPSGDPAPSSADLDVTRMIHEASKAVDITLVDHVIVGRQGADPAGRGFYSFRQSGLI